MMIFVDDKLIINKFYSAFQSVPFWEFGYGEDYPAAVNPRWKGRTDVA